MAKAKAVLNNVPSSPRKMRYVIDMIRGVDVDKALNILKFSTKHPARQVEKLLISATSNWTAKNEGLNPEDAQLFVKEVFVNAGVTLKRWLPAPQGRAYRLRKRSNHLTLIVDSRIAPEVAVTETAVEEVEAPVAEVAEAPKKKTTRKKSSDTEATEKPAKKTTRKTKKAE